MLPQTGVCADGFLFLLEEGLQRRSADGTQQQQQRAFDFDVLAAVRFKDAQMAIKLLVVLSPQWMPRGALCGFPVVRTFLRMGMSLWSNGSSAATDVVRIGISCALLDV